MNKVLPTTIHFNICSRQDRLATEVVASFYSDSDQAKRLDTIVGALLPLIPRHLGFRALDDAVDALLTAHQAYLRDKREMTSEICTKYGQALRSLKGAIEDPKTSLKTETLCATQILSYFEVCFRERKL